MYIALTIIIIIASILLTLVVLVQNSKGGGLAAGFQSSNQYMGVRKTTDFLEKTTWGLISIVVVLSVFAVGINTGRSATERDSIIKGQQVDLTRQIQEGTAVPNFGEVPQTIDPEEQSAE